MNAFGIHQKGRDTCCSSRLQGQSGNAADSGDAHENPKESEGGVETEAVQHGTWPNATGHG